MNTPANRFSNGLEVVKINDFLKPKSVIMDIGAGTGRLSIPLMKRSNGGHEIIAIEPSSAMVNMLQNKVINNKLVRKFTCHSDKINTLILDEQVDMAIALFMVLNMITEYDELLLLFQKVKYHLKENGFFMIDFISDFRPFKKYAYHTNGVVFEGNVTAVTQNKYLWRESIENFIDKTGRVKIETTLRKWTKKEITNTAMKVGLTVIIDDLLIRGGYNGMVFQNI